MATASLRCVRIKPAAPIVPTLSTSCCRQFSSSASLSAKSTIKRVKHQHNGVPPYPYGINRWYKKSNLGLYGGLMVRTGHNVGKDTENKTPRKWRPNVVRKKLYSAALDRLIRIKVCTSVLRTIDKNGGLDEYLLGEKPQRIKELGMFGWLLRWRLMQSPVVQERFRLERLRLGLVDEEPKATTTGMQGEQISQEELVHQIEQFDSELEQQQADELAAEGEVPSDALAGPESIPAEITIPENVNQPEHRA